VNLHSPLRKIYLVHHVSLRSTTCSVQSRIRSPRLISTAMSSPSLSAASHLPCVSTTSSGEVFDPSPAQTYHSRPSLKPCHAEMTNDDDPQHRFRAADLSSWTLSTPPPVLAGVPYPHPARIARPWSNAFTNPSTVTGSSGAAAEVAGGGQRQPRNRTESGADITADQTVTGPLQAASQGKYPPRPAFVPDGSHLLWLRHGLPGRPSRKAGGRLRKGVASRRTISLQGASFISTASSHDPYGTTASNASFDPVWARRGRAGVGRFTRQAELVSARAQSGFRKRARRSPDANGFLNRKTWACGRRVVLLMAEVEELQDQLRGQAGRGEWQRRVSDIAATLGNVEEDVVRRDG